MSSIISFILFVLILSAPHNVLRPPITGYNVYHNATSSYISLVSDNITVTHTVLAGVGSYTVIVNADNIIGSGENTSIVG